MIAIVTGASRGIGRAVAEKFLQDGYTVLGGSKSPQHLQKTADELKQSGLNAFHYMPADLSTSDGVKAFAQWCLTHGSPNVLVNNAGTFIPGNCIDEADGALEIMINTNLYSAYRLTRSVLPAMLKNRGGHIFNICSIAALKAYPAGGSYSISKYALKGFTENLRHELKEHHIKVTGVYPGAVMTDSWKGFDNSEGRILEVNDISTMILAATKLSFQACVEDIVIRPQLGDL